MNSEATFSFVPLDSKRHDRDAFTCGEPSLDRYLKTQVSQETKRGFSACFVAATPEGRIAGYYTLSAYAVLVNDLPDSTRRKLPTYPTVPTYLLGKLAIDVDFQGRGLGGALLADALTRVCQAEIPAFALVVDALNDTAASFYTHHGFAPFASASNRFFLPLATARKA